MTALYYDLEVEPVVTRMLYRFRNELVGLQGNCDQAWSHQSLHEDASSVQDRLNLRATLKAVMGAQPLPDHNYTLEEFLDFEDQSDERHEFVDGYILPIVAGTFTHSELCVSVITLFRQAFFPACHVFDSHLMVQIEMIGRPVYPDCMVLCGTPIFFQNRKTVITNPTIVVEVLSPSSGSYDRGTKTDYYRSIPSVQNILLLHQDRRLVELFERVSDRWMITQHLAGTSFSIHQTTFSVDEIYNHVVV